MSKKKIKLKNIWNVVNNITQQTSRDGYELIRMTKDNHTRFEALAKEIDNFTDTIKNITDEYFNNDRETALGKITELINRTAQLDIQIRKKLSEEAASEKQHEQNELLMNSTRERIDQLRNQLLKLTFKKTNVFKNITLELENLDQSINNTEHQYLNNSIIAVMENETHRSLAEIGYTSTVNPHQEEKLLTNTTAGGKLKN